MKTLIVYGTRYGATASTSEEIAKILREADFDVNVINPKEEKVKDLSSYELVVVGSGLQMGKWTGEAEDFLKKHHHELSKKKLALFASTLKSMPEREGKTEEVQKIRKTALEEKVLKYNLQPVALGFFGGVINFNKMNIIARKAIGFLKPQLEKDGFKEVQSGVYDLRDWEEIRTWTNELASKASQ